MHKSSKIDLKDKLWELIQNKKLKGYLDSHYNRGCFTFIIKHVYVNIKNIHQYNLFYAYSQSSSKLALLMILRS